MISGDAWQPARDSCTSTLEGEVQPCPCSPYSDANLNEVNLIEAFQSPLLRVIRADSKRLDESNGMCALWNKRAWVAELAKAKNQA